MPTALPGRPHEAGEGSRPLMRSLLRRRGRRAQLARLELLFATHRARSPPSRTSRRVMVQAPLITGSARRLENDVGTPGRAEEVVGRRVVRPADHGVCDFIERDGLVRAIASGDSTIVPVLQRCRVSTSIGSRPVPPLDPRDWHTLGRVQSSRGDGPRVGTQDHHLVDRREAEGIALVQLDEWLALIGSHQREADLIGVFDHPRQETSREPPDQAYQAPSGLRVRRRAGRSLKDSPGEHAISSRWGRLARVQRRERRRRLS